MGHVLPAADPVTDFLARDWAGIGGWGLFLGLVLFFVIGAFRETWVPGRRYRELEKQYDKSVNLNATLADQNKDLIRANQITAHFFEDVPVRAARRDTGEDPGGEPS